MECQLGSLHLSVREVAQILLTHSGDNAVIVWEIRLPRIFAAILLGGALSVSGFLLQTFFANPIAGPFVLGISSGAKLTGRADDDRRAVLRGACSALPS